MSTDLLLVDDDAAALYALREMLSDLPLRLTLARSGEEALRQILKAEFALVMLDVRLPKMDGFAVAAAIRSLERTRRTPILFMSANEDRRRQPRVEALDEHYFRKPLMPDLVRAKILEMLGPPAPAGELQPLSGPRTGSSTAA
jgi:CheY-like chemotaxis protein